MLSFFVSSFNNFTGVLQMKKHNFEKIAYAAGIITFTVYAFIYLYFGILPKGAVFGHFVYNRGWDVFLLPLSVILYEFILNFKMDHDMDDSYQLHTLKDFFNTWIFIPQNLAAAGFFLGLLIGFFYGFLNALVLVLIGYLLVPMMIITLIAIVMIALFMAIIIGICFILFFYPLLKPKIKAVWAQIEKTPSESQ